VEIFCVQTSAYNLDQPQRTPPGTHFSSLEAVTKKVFQGDEVTNTLEKLFFVGR
jgi:hypothetical protein